MTTFYKNLRPKLFLLIATLFYGISSFAQSSNYGFAQSTGTYTAITGTASTASGDDGTQNQLPIGFSFNFAGSPYTTFSVTTNGFIKLGTNNIVTGTNNYNNGDYFGSAVTTNANVPMLAAYWDDNNLTGGSIQYTTSGTVGSQILTVQWTNCHMGDGGSGSTATYSFQIKLYEGTNNIQFVYGASSGAFANSTASIGITSAATNYLSVTPGATATASNSAINSTVSAAVAANTIYTFTPPPACTGTPNPGNTIASVTNVCGGVGFNLSLQNNPAVSGLTYLWEASLNGTTYTALTGTNNNATYTATQTVPTYYRCTVTCTTGPNSAPSTPILVGMSPFNNCYCTPASSCVNEGIENVTMGTLNNSSNFCANATGYSNYTGLGSLTTVTQGAAVPISVSAHINSSPASAGLWIDYNHNGIFDATEYTSLGSASVTIPTGGVSNVFSGTVNIDIAALTGVTRMRVRSANQGGITNTSACTNSGVYGEYEDYLITINAATNCTGTPVGGTVAASNTTVCTNGSTTLSATGYTAAATGMIYQWQVSTNGGSTYNNIGAGTLNYADYTVTNISQTSMYRLSILCGPSSSTGYSNAVTVTVPAPLSLSLNEGFNTGGFPGCWAQQYVSGTSNFTFPTSSTNPTTAPQEGTNFVLWNSFASNTPAGAVTRLVSPALSTTGTASVDVSFFWMNENNTSYNAGAYLTEGAQVQYSLDGTTWVDAGAFIPRHDGSLAAGVAQWKQKTVTLPAAAGNVPLVFIGFKFTSAYGDNCALDAASVAATPSCQLPSAVNTTTVGSTTATIAWTASPSAPANGYQYYVSSTNTAPISTTTPTGSVGAGVLTANLTLLAPATTYYVWVRSACSGSLQSGWTATPLSFTTFCAGIAPGWTEGFESLTTLGATNFPSCWVKENGDWASSAATTYNTAHGGANYIRDAWNATNEYIWTPPFSLTAGTSYDFSFYVQGDGYTDWTMDVFRNTTQSSVGATQIGTSYTPAGTGSASIQPYVLKTYTFIPTTTGTYSFGIRINEPTGNPWYMAFDDFSLNVTPSCGVPTMTAATAVTSVAATINWTAPATAPANGYEYYYSTSNTAPTSTTTPSGTTAAGVTTKNLTTLAPATTYYAWVRSVCGVGLNSAWSAASSSFTTQCTAAALPLTEGFNTSANNINPSCWTQQYVTGTSNITFETAITHPANTPYEGTRSIFWNAYNITGGNATRLVSAPLNSTGLNSVDVKFYWLNENTDYTDPSNGDYNEGVQVQYSLNGTTWVDAGAFIPRPDTTLPFADTSIWNLKTVTLPAAAANQALVYVGFKFVSNYGNNCAMDAVNIAGTCPTVDLGNNVVACNTGEFTDTLNAGNTGATYLWDNATTAQTRVVNTSGTYYVAVSQNGCTRSDSLTVTLNALPVVHLGNDTAICSGTPLILDAGNTGSIYVWNDTTTTQTRSVNVAGTYDVLVTDTSNCSASDTIQVTLIPAPSATINASTTSPGNYSFNPGSPENVIGYGWSFGDGSSNSNQTSPTHVYTENGTYTVTLTLVGICGDTTVVTQQITVSGITGIHTITLANDLLTLYPNPATHILNITNKSTYEMQNVSIYNVVGQLIYTAVADSKTNHKLQLSGFTSGMYTLKIETDKGFVMRKFEVVK